MLGFVCSLKPLVDEMYCIVMDFEVVFGWYGEDISLESMVFWQKVVDLLVN